MSQACRLYLDEQQLSAWMYRRGRWQETAVFPNREEAESLFADFLQRHRRQRFVLIVNQAAEHRVILPLPEASPSEQVHLAESRAARLFHDTPWRCVSIQTPAGQASLLALSNTPVLQHWSDILRHSGAALVGVFSLVQWLPAALRKLPEWNAPELLVLSSHGEQARLSLLCHGLVVHSRLLPNLPSFEQLTDFSAPGVLTQPAKTRPLCLIGPGAWPAAVEYPGKVQHIVTEGTNSAPHFLGLPERLWPKQQFAPKDHLQAARLQVLRYRINSLTFILALSGLAVLAERTIAAADIDEQIYTEKQGLASLRTEIQSLKARSSEPAETLENLRHLARHPLPIDANADKNTLRRSLLALSLALQSHPDFWLDKLTWKNGILTRSTAENTQNPEEIQIAGKLLANPDAHPLRLWQNFQQALQTSFSVTPARLPGQTDAQGNVPFSLRLTARAGQ